MLTTLFAPSLRPKLEPCGTRAGSDEGVKAVADESASATPGGSCSRDDRAYRKSARGQRPDRSPRDLGQLEMPSERNADEHDQLGGGIVAIDVGARIGFRVAEPLRVGEHDLHRLVVADMRLRT